MNVLLLIPDGVGVRNFILGPFLKQVTEYHQVFLLHPVPRELLDVYLAGFNSNVQGEYLVSNRESLLSSILRYSLSYAQMYWADTQAMRFNRSLPVKGSWRRKTLHRMAKMAGRVAASPKGIQLLERWHCEAAGRLKGVAYYHSLFEEIKPSVLFCSHQRPLNIIPPVRAAQMLNIPTATFIFSWDNLTSKGRIMLPFDYYLVWSEHMRQELIRYYPNVSSDKIHVIGTPQFDPYADETLIWSREEFFEKIGADSGRPLICYSGGDHGTCPEDPDHLRILMELIRAGKIKGNPQVIARPAPVDDGKRYDDVRNAFPGLIFSQPEWIHIRPGDWTSVQPTAGDVKFLANLAHHCDLNINMASTMTLDFAIHDKPVVNIAFDVADPPPFGVSLWDFFYRFEHYRPVVEMGAARFARSSEELAQHVNAYLENPSLDKDNRRRLVELEVGYPIGQSGRRIIEVLEQISEERSGRDKEYEAYRRRVAGRQDKEEKRLSDD
jgi:hypothetical protein